jgi:glycosidase
MVNGWSGGDPKSLAFANRFDVFHTNILDFQLALRLNQYVGGAAEDPTQQFSAQDLAAYLTERVSAFDGRDDWQGTFIDNHDQMRTVVRLHKLGLSEEESERRLDLATVLLMTVRGIPIIMWGDGAMSSISPISMTMPIRPRHRSTIGMTAPGTELG